MQKIGKRKVAPATQNPEWLFPTPANKAKASTTIPPASAAPIPSKKFKAKEEKKLAKELIKRRDAGEIPKPAPPAELVGLVSVAFTSVKNARTNRLT